MFARLSTRSSVLRAIPLRNAAVCTARAFATAARKALTLEQALTSSHLIIGQLESATATQQLNAVRAGGDILTKWGQANAVLVQATLQALPQMGFSADGQGLHKYTDAFADCVRNGSPEERRMLQQVNEAKWRVLLENAFGCSPAPAITLAKAREIAIDMVDALQDPALLRPVLVDEDGPEERRVLQCIDHVDGNFASLCERDGRRRATAKGILEEHTPLCLVHLLQHPPFFR